ncbi:hypothetical protein LV84_02850 [Algoriphagus ratkowskyi]|uniref:RNA polymerase sigma-70 factor (ECF subfamily) n=1 Tax=Algoriphagus ratkowskyi TaxID=57028 RepID=A0A2W7RGL1_9BACT|nr:hypothetical protein [Algoriphagus ratkowskyi]PZX54697.1 hypothetical protein LV84_02850 [Algoriphagus ratkowskyi]
MKIVNNQTFTDFQNGDIQAIDELYNFYKPYVIRFIVSLIKDAEESEAIFIMFS